MTQTTTQAGEALTGDLGYYLLAIVVVGVLLAGVLVVVGRKWLQPDSKEDAGSLVRSWAAIALVLGLLVFCAASFVIDDPDLRNLLLGGLIANVGAAIAFYFSSKSADEARSDIMGASLAMSQGGMKPTAFSRAKPPGGNKGDTDYEYHFIANGQPPPSYKKGSGQLPVGLALDDDGRLHGDLAEAGDFEFTVMASNAFGSHSTRGLKVTVK